MTQAVKNTVLLDDYKKLNRQNSLLFAIGAFCVLAGFLCPPIPVLIDVLIILALALTASVVAVCLFGSKPSELTGLPALAIAAVSALLIAAIASAKLAIIDEAAPGIIMQVVKFDVISRLLSPALATLFFIAVSASLLIISLRQINLLLTRSREHLEFLTASGQSNGEFNLVITDSSADEQDPKILAAREKDFFHSANAFGRLAIWMGILISAVVILSLVGAVLAGSTITAVSTQTLTGFAAGAGLSLQLVYLCAVFAVAHLVNKSAAESHQQNCMTEEQFQNRIKVVAREVADRQMPEVDESLLITSRFEPVEEINNHQPLPLFDGNSFDDDAAYDCIADILTESKTSQVALMTSKKPQDLPVTIAVNVATRLTAKNAKTLIIDFDLQRCAVQQVFQAGDCESKAARTCIENLSLLSAKRLASAKQDKLRKIFTKAETIYDYIIIYAPNAEVPENMCEFFTTAMLFAKEKLSADSELTNLGKKLNESGCRLLEPAELLQTN